MQRVVRNRMATCVPEKRNLVTAHFADSSMTSEAQQLPHESDLVLRIQARLTGALICGIPCLKQFNLSANRHHLAKS